MVNPRRVRRIKNFIYVLIILIVLVPAVVVSWLGIKLLIMLGSGDTGALLSIFTPPAIEQRLPDDDSGGYGYAIDPQSQNSSAAGGAQNDPEPDETDLPGSGEAMPGDGDAADKPQNSGTDLLLAEPSGSEADAGQSADAGSADPDNGTADSRPAGSDESSASGQAPADVPTENGSLPYTGAGALSA